MRLNDVIELFSSLQYSPYQCSWSIYFLGWHSLLGNASFEYFGRCVSGDIYLI